jgi:hypothetical protein
MVVGQEKIGETAAKLMDRIEEQGGEMVEILDCMIVVEIQEGDEATTLQQFSTKRLTVQEGLVLEAAIVTIFDRLSEDD